MDDVARVRRASLDAWRRPVDADGRQSVNDDMIDRCRRVTCAFRANAVEPIARGVVK